MKEEIRNELFSLQDLEYKKFHSNLCPNIDNIIGVRVPEIKKIAKRIVKETKIKYLEVVDNKYYEETMIEGLVIAYSKISLSEKINYLKIFVPKIDNWAICDSVSASLKLKQTEMNEFWKYIITYQNSDKEFELRFMIVVMMDYFIDTKFDEIIKIIDKIKVDYYYTNVAIAWLISFMYISDKTKTISYLKKNNLSNFIHNKAIQKIRESNRVSKEDKEMLNNLKRK